MNTLINEEREEKKLIVVENSKKEATNKKQKTKLFIAILVSLLLIESIEWLYRTTGNLTIEQLIFHLKVPLKGTNVNMILQYIIAVVPLAIILSFVIMFIINYFREKGKARKAGTIILGLSIVYVLTRANIGGYVLNQITASNFIEENYVAIQEEKIILPEEKNNLIYIFLESMESSYTSTEYGGMQKDDYIKELRELAEENMHFSNTEKLGGAIQLSGTGWTIAGMVSQTSGMPLKISIEQNSYGKYDEFLPGIKNIGEILQQNGYQNYLLLGSDATFGGRENYFTQHGNYKIWDVNTAIEQGRMKEEDKIWWGYDDKDLFEYAKEQLIEISRNGQPFNYTMLTVDTHFSDGYICPKCENKFDTQYANVVACSSKQVTEFVKWIQEQEFYKNTTIVISGDHLTMQVLSENSVDKNYQRTIYNAIINPSKSLDISNIKTTNREFSSIDMFPTTLAALGAKIEEGRLGLGTNLFSDKETIIEEYGYKMVNTEIEKKSKFYEQKFIYAEQ
ncbi:MAG: sulfatase-like hydrolase/transferase [Clostridia bacterium]|nr:sulfatase-like hydrolase/transferase [Clostridia bacterium]